MPNEKPQFVHLMMDSTLVHRLDEFKHKNRFGARSAAARWLFQWALDQKPEVPRELPEMVMQRQLAELVRRLEEGDGGGALGKLLDLGFWQLIGSPRARAGWAGDPGRRFGLTRVRRLRRDLISARQLIEQGNLAEALFLTKSAVTRWEKRPG